jgi:signal transduction histidine kinase
MYRGPDRRRAAYADSRDLSGGWVPMAAVVFGVSAVAALTDRHPLAVSNGALDDRVFLIAASLVGSSAAFLVLRWRLTNHATSLYAAAALIGATLTIVVSEPAVFGLAGKLDRHALPVTALITVAVAWRATAVPEIDSGLRAVRVLGAFALVLVTGVVGLAAFDIQYPAPGERTYVALALCAALGWAAVAWLWIREGHRRRDWGIAWGSVLFMAFAGWQAAAAGAASTSRSVGVASTVLVSVGALAALRGAIESLREAIELQRRELQVVRARVNQDHAEAQQTRAAAEERAHEARNALHAVGAAILTLERYHERLDEQTKRKLSAGVASELARLQRLIDLDERVEPVRTFSLLEALEAVIVGAVGDGLELDVDVPRDVLVVGQQQATAEIVQNLLVNAQRHAGGRDVALRAHGDGTRVVVLVCDRGPGVPRGDREAIFDRSHANAATGGSGFGLYVSRRLARSQGGDLWVTDRPGGGAVFGFDLASARGDVVAASVGDERHELGDAGGR